MREIVVPLVPAYDAPLLIRNAIDIGREIGARVCVGDSVPFPAHFPYDETGDYQREIPTLLETHAAARRAALRREFKGVVADARETSNRSASPSAPPVLWVDGVKDGENVWDRAMLADMILVRRPSQDDSMERAVVLSALYGACRPILAIPERTARIEGGTAIAWDGSNAAAAALRSALQVLQLSDPISVLQFGPLPEGLPTATEAVKYLERYGRRAEVLYCVNGPQATSTTILRETGAAGAGLLIAGARRPPRPVRIGVQYVAEDLLSRAHIPVFMAHAPGDAF